MFIAAGHLAQLKREAGFADIDPGRMTTEQGRELAARYNGGPGWEGQQAQDYANDYMRHREKAAEALR